MKNKFAISALIIICLFTIQGGIADSALAPAISAPAKPAVTTKLMLLADDDKQVPGEMVKIRVWLKSQELINIVSGKIVFDPDMYALEKVDKSKSIASLWLFEPNIKTATDSVRFGAAMIYPGFEGEGELFSLDLKVKGKATSSPIYFTNEEIFVADGTGSKMAISTTSMMSAIAQAPIAARSGFDKFAVRSFTHEQGAWSNKTRASFYWPAGYQAAFSFNTLPTSDPGRGTKKQTHASFDAKKNGTYYFHLRVRDKSGASKLFHYKIRIDTSKPSDFSAVPSFPKQVGSLLSVKLKAKDALSGFSYFNVILDGRSKRITAASYAAPVTLSGNHRLTVRVFDKAGNYQETTKSFSVN
jgi:hypothetical protein